MLSCAIIGPRAATKEQCEVLTCLSCYADVLGFRRVSGGADGCDKCAEVGWVREESMDIFRPKHATDAARHIASQHHPAWEACKPYVRDLHGRNAQIILGLNVETPVNFVLTCTDNEERGGTAVGLRIAKSYNIPIFNTYFIRVEYIMKAIFAIKQGSFKHEVWKAQIDQFKKTG